MAKTKSANKTPLTREQCDAALAAALQVLLEGHGEQTRKRMVRALARAAAGMEFDLGHNRETAIALAIKATLDVEQEKMLETSVSALNAALKA